MKRRHQNGFSIVGIMVGLSAFTIVLLTNINIVMSQVSHVMRMNHYLTASLLKQNTSELLNNPSVIDRLFLNHTLTDAGPVNTGTNNIGLKCIVNFKNGPQNINCPHQKIPTGSFGSTCGAMATLDSKTTCWIKENLDNYKVEVVFHPDPTKSTTTELLVDNRTDLPRGLTTDFKVCENFSRVEGAGDFINCPYRMEIYAWVECDGAAVFCGGGTGVLGTIRMAAIPIPHGIIRPFDQTKYSILNLNVGRL